jgi:putative endonuclease
MHFNETDLKQSKILYVYILKCSDDSYYIGVTNNLELRLAQHNEGVLVSSYTYNKRPVQLVYYERFDNYYLAIEWEKKIKGWTRRKKEALMEQNWEKLKEYSKCNNSSVAIQKIKELETPFDSAQGDITHMSF